MTIGMIGMTQAKTVLVDFLFCSSALEKKTAILYKNLAEKIRSPLVKSILLHIAIDSEKHSAIFSGLGESIGKPTAKSRECGKRLGQVWKLAETFSREVVSKQRMSEEEMAHLVGRLVPLEIGMGEEYYALTQAKTLVFMVKEIRQIYNVNLQSIRHILKTVIRDEEKHQRLLATVKKILTKKERKEKDKAPEVRYQSPDSWIRSLPPTS
jgi:rubrerythrin